MIRPVAVAFALGLASSAQAMPLAPLHPDDMVTTVRQACGAGFHRVHGVCVRNTTARAVRRSYYSGGGYWGQQQPYGYWGQQQPYGYYGGYWGQQQPYWGYQRPYYGGY